MTLEIIMAAAWGIVVAAAGAFLTNLSPWYYQLKKPSWQPPDWLFGPAWTLILTLASIAFYLGWTRAGGSNERALVAVLFVVNGTLNVFWSPMFFTWRRPDWALMEVPFLWLSILAMIVFLAPISSLAAILVVPYLLWVSFAAFLNVTIVRLNRPFGAAARSRLGNA